jgi:hypothetical protein
MPLFNPMPYNALLNGGVYLALFFSALCKKSDKYTESVAAIGYVLI